MGAIIVEILNRRDHVQSRQRIEGKNTFTIGRSAHCDVIVDDIYVAPSHVAVHIADDGSIMLTDQNSVNGIWFKGQRIRGAQSTPLTGNEFRIGHTRLRVRVPNEALAPERADGAAAREENISYGKWFAIGLIACVTWVSFFAWLDAPRDVTAKVAGLLVGFGIAAGIWIAIWALLSRVMLLEWRWLTHGAILFCSLAAVLLLDSAFDIGLFALDFRAPRWLKICFVTLVASAILYLHLRHASPLRKRAAAIVAFVIPALGFGTLSWVEARSQKFNVNYIDEAREIFPPYIRLRAAKPLEGFIAATAKLKVEADEKRRVANEEGDDEDLMLEN